MNMDCLFSGKAEGFIRLKFCGREGGRIDPNVFADVEFSGKSVGRRTLARKKQVAVLTW